MPQNNASKFSISQRQKDSDQTERKSSDVFILAVSKVNRDIKLKSISGVRERFHLLNFKYYWPLLQFQIWNTRHRTVCSYYTRF